MDTTILSRTIIYEGWLSLSRLALRMPDGRIEERHVEDHGDGVAVLPYDPVRKTALLVSMPRAPVLCNGHPTVLEAVAGRIEHNKPDDEARREALEEAGLRLGALEAAGVVWMMPSVSTERLHLYLAPFTSEDRIHAGGGAAEENEGITVHELALDQLATLIRKQSLPDAKTVLLIQTLMLRRPCLFTSSGN